MEEFARYDARLRNEAIGPILNKLGQLLVAAPVRNVLGQMQRKIDLRLMMDQGRILLANLSKGQLGADKTNLLGSLLMAQFEQAALSRADLPAEERRPFWLLADEFQSFCTHSFATALSEVQRFQPPPILGI